MANSDHVKSLLKALDILQVTARAPEGLRLNEIAAELGIKVTTAHNLVRTLAHRSFLEKDSGGSIRIGPAVYDLMALDSQKSILSAAEAVMKDVQKELPDATLTFAEQRGGRVSVRLRMSPDLPGIIQRPDNMPMNLYGGASGLVFMAFASPEDVETLTRDCSFEEFGVHLWKNRASLDKYLDTVRKTGVASNFKWYSESFPCAAPVFKTGKSLAGTFGVCLKTAASSEKQKQEAVSFAVSAAGRISEKLR